MSSALARRLAFLGGGLWLGIVLYATLAPRGSGFNTSGDFRVQPNLVPLQDVLRVWRNSHDRGWQLVGNLLLMMPLGVAAGLGRFSRRAWLDVVAALTLAVLIEVAQWWALPVRVASIDDVLLNVAGFALADLTTRRVIAT